MNVCYIYLRAIGAESEAVRCIFFDNANNLLSYLQYNLSELIAILHAGKGFMHLVH